MDNQVKLIVDPSRSEDCYSQCAQCGGMIYDDSPLCEGCTPPPTTQEEKRRETRNAVLGALEQALQHLAIAKEQAEVYDKEIGYAWYGDLILVQAAETDIKEQLRTLFRQGVAGVSKHWRS